MSHDTSPLDDGQPDLFDVVDDVEIPVAAETQASYEKRMGQIAKTVFDPWYESWYIGRYTQSPGHIIKVFTAGIKAGVSADDLFWAANILGKDTKPITEFSLQWALSQVFKEKERTLKAVDITDREYNKEYGQGFE